MKIREATYKKDEYHTYLMDVVVVGSRESFWEVARGIDDIKLVDGSNDNLDLQFRCFHSRASMTS